MLSYAGGELVLVLVLDLNLPNTDANTPLSLPSISTNSNFEYIQLNAKEAFLFLLTGIYEWALLCFRY